MGSQASGLHHSLMPCLSLISHLRSKLYILKGKKWVFEAAGAPCWVDLNYICVCLCTCACSTQQEIWDGSSLGTCLGLLSAEKPGQSWRGPKSAVPAPPSPWHADACWQGHWRALSGSWPVAAADTHCLWATSCLCL